MLFDHKSLIAGSGIPGKSGATFTPSVSQEGILSWSNDRGLENPEAVHIKGPKGDIGNTGPQGPPGDAAPVSYTHLTLPTT